MLLFHLRFRVLVIASHVLHDAIEYDIVCNSKDKEQPEEIQALQSSQEPECDVLTDPAFVLLRVPVQLERANVGEGGQGRV